MVESSSLPFLITDNNFGNNDILCMWRLGGSQERTKNIYWAFLDLRKAFDCVDRKSLWVKLVSF